MVGETDLDKLLASMEPRLLDDDYVFCTVSEAKYGDFSDISPLATYMEKEGLTLVVTKENALKANLAFEGVFKCITLSVHSSLEAVGLTAAVSSKLAEKKISANVIAAYYHDHIFVQEEKSDMALKALSEFNTD